MSAGVIRGAVSPLAWISCSILLLISIFLYELRLGAGIELKLGYVGWNPATLISYVMPALMIGLSQVLELKPTPKKGLSSIHTGYSISVFDTCDAMLLQ